MRVSESLLLGTHHQDEVHQRTVQAGQSGKSYETEGEGCTRLR